MLTALSVARDCQMIDRHDHIVMVTGLPPSDVSPARLEYTCSEVSVMVNIYLSYYCRTSSVEEAKWVK